MQNQRRDPTGQGRDSLGRGTSPEDLAQVADQAPAAMREVEAQKDYLRGAYRDPDQAADALDKLIERSGRDLRVAARTLREDGPEVLTWSTVRTTPMPYRLLKLADVYA